MCTYAKFVSFQVADSLDMYRVVDTLITYHLSSLPHKI